MIATKSQRAKIADLERLKESIPDNWALCGLFKGTGAACEAEMMVAQTLHAAVANQREEGKPFSYKGPGVERTMQKCGTDNYTAYHMLLDEGYFVEDEHRGIPAIFMTQKLVDRLDGHLKTKKAKECPAPTTNNP